MFKLEYIAATLGVDIEMGGIAVYESPAAGEVVANAGLIALTNTAVAFDGTKIGWYKKPTDANWSVGTINDSNQLVIPNAAVSDSYCIKYFYQAESARFITIKSQYVPKILHLVILNDLYSGDPQNVGSGTRYGRLITDIPAFQLDGSQDLSLTATSAATVSLAGSALAVESGDSCEEDPYYGTMTEYIYGSNWQDSVIALAVENSEMELAQGDTETAIVRVVYGGSVASQRKDNSNFTFTVKSGTSATVANTGVVTGASGTGTTIIEVALTGYDNVAPAYIYVTKAS